MIERKIKRNGRVYEFSDIMDFLDYAKSGPEDGKSRQRGGERDEFCGGSWDDAVRQAETGNPELVANIFDGVNVISAMIEEEKIGEIRDVTGEYFDVADFLTGEPEVFRRDEYGDRKPVVPVYASFSMDCEIPNDIIRNRGCAVVALCDELSKGGFIVDLHIVHAVDQSILDNFKGKHFTNIRVGLDPLDLDTAAFILANPLCLRRLWFAMIEHATGNDDCGGYGRPIEYDLNEIFATGLSGFYFTSSGHDSFKTRNYRTMEDVKKHILGMVDKFKNSAEQIILG